jgi:hypothetical protein
VRLPEHNGVYLAPGERCRPALSRPLPRRLSLATAAPPPLATPGCTGSWRGCRPTQGTEARRRRAEGRTREPRPLDRLLPLLDPLLRRPAPVVDGHHPPGSSRRLLRKRNLADATRAESHAGRLTKSPLEVGPPLRETLGPGRRLVPLDVVGDDGLEPGTLPDPAREHKLWRGPVCGCRDGDRYQHDLRL